MTTTGGDTRLTRLAVAVGFGLLFVGTLSAHRAPATTYELSVLAETPSTYFVGVGVAILVSLWTSFGAQSRVVNYSGYLLGGLAVATLLMLPVIRGYYLYIGGDALTHLGWSKDILAGRLSPIDLLYPGLHTTTILVAAVTGIRLGLTQMHVTLVMLTVFVAFTVLCIRYLGARTWAVPVGVFSALLLLPNNNISVHLEGHPVTHSLLLFPLALYLVFRYVSRDGSDGTQARLASPTGTLLALTSVAMVLVHPQGALNLVVILVAAWLVQRFVDLAGATGGIADHRSLGSQALVATAAFLLWTPRHERVRASVAGVVNGLLESNPAGDVISQRTGSLTAVGGSVPELFVKLFFPATVFSVLAGLLCLAWVSGRLADRYSRRNHLLPYVVVALVVLSTVFVVVFAASAEAIHFRYLGFVMVPVTILGALAITSVVATLSGDGSLGRSGRVVLVVLFLVLLPLPLATVHSTPFIYQPTSHMTEMHYDGARTTYERMDREIAFAGLRIGPERLLHGTYGTARAQELGFEGTGETAAIPYRVFETNLTEHYDDPRYVPITDADYRREVGLYDGLRYDAPGFRRLDTEPDVARVISTGGYRLYLVNRTA